MDAATRANLELVRFAPGRACREPLAAIDRTVTAAGSRGNRPAGSAALDRSQGAPCAARCGCRSLMSRGSASRCTAHALGARPDLARALARLGSSRGGPRDLAPFVMPIRPPKRLRRCWAPQGMRARCSDCAPGSWRRRRGAARGSDRSRSPRCFTRGARRHASPEPRATAASSGTAPMPISTRIGACATAAARSIAGLAGDLCRGDRRSSRCKVRHNNVLGYFVEVTALHGAA